jgi:membrane protease YdiL (CAAX protease family)
LTSKNIFKLKNGETMLKHYFINSEEKRLRAGWRLLLFLIAVPLTMRLLTLIIVPIFGSLNDINAVKWFSRGILVVVGMTLLVFVFIKFIDKKSFVSLGLRFNKNATWDLLVGFFLSGFMVGIFFLILLYSGKLQINEISWKNPELMTLIEILLLFFGVGIATGFSEELGYRGYILQNLGEGIGLVWAIVVSCILYGIMHMANPNSTLLSGSLITIFGFLRIFGWLRTGQLWLSIGMHAGWNFFQGPIFGFSVSGMNSNHLIKQTLNGPSWLTGGDFGPEGSIIVFPVVLFALVVMYFWSVKHKDTPWFQLKK